MPSPGNDPRKGLRPWFDEFRRTHVAAILLILFFLLSVPGLGLVRDLAPKTWTQQTERYHLKKFLAANPENADSWYPMSIAYDFVLCYGGDSLYDAVLFQNGIKFQYPPTSLLYFRAIEVIDPEPVAGPRAGNRLNEPLVWGWVWAFEKTAWWGTALAIVFSVALLLVALAEAGRLSGRGFGVGDVLVCAVAGALLALFFFPLIRGFTIGQIQPVIAGLFAVAMIVWWFGGRVTAGVCIGLACLIKPQLAVLLVWALIRRDWRFSAGLLVTAVAGGLISIQCFGWKAHVDYLGVLAFISRHGESFYANASVNGLLHRALFNGNNAAWVGNSFAPYHPVVYYGTLVTSLLILGVVCWPVRIGLDDPTRRLRQTVDLGLAGLGATIASPVAWEHHYSILPPLFAVLFAAMLVGRGRVPVAGLVLLGVAFFLCGKYFDQAVQLAETPFNILQSYRLGGGLLTMYLAVKVRNGSLPGEDIALAGQES